MENLNEIIFTIAQSLPGFLLAIVAHEAAHAYVALRFGDRTAQMAGRLTLNPAAHYDMWGTVLFPLLSAFTGFAIIGWAKPVPIDIRNFKQIKKGIFWVSFAGPLSNIILGTLSAFLVALVATQVSPAFGYYGVIIGMLKYSVFINFILAGFNLIPLPPLDGSKMLSTFLKGEALRKYEAFAAYTPMIFMGALLLSFVGIHTIGYLLAPAQWAGQWLIMSFYGLMAPI
ncbi:MAG: site-2 protease family protein [Bacteriovoracaceae bacterium]|nr:site-2 protease family protein [Bacteriovoracaceae bacterium]